MKEFLHDKTQKEVIGSIFSETLPIFSGVPQGETICQFLFIFYTNSITLKIGVSSNIILFADDTNHFSYSNSFLQISLDIIYHWRKKHYKNPSNYNVLNIQKNTSISTFNFKMNDKNLSSTKMFKNLLIFIAEY